MNNNLIITIGRQFGSGGREIGKLLSELFGIAYYDKELINEASKSSGLSTEYFEKADERAPSALLNSFSINWLTGAGGLWGDGGLSNEYIFKFQSDVIRHLAETQSCVIVGRCADYILRHYPRCYNVFIHAPLEDCVERIICRSPELSRKEAIELAEKKNKLRASYYNFYTDKGWGVSSSYDLSIDSSILGSEATAQFIRDFILKKDQQPKWDKKYNSYY
ncbi:MAG TPA: cytidylate kinase-like family protein [Candidatus Barnesiella excrementigallinarum]|nr:cytidylate kinase-like family protein [Candidatus Barnesiella excrementigallinarum]